MTSLNERLCLMPALLLGCIQTEHFLPMNHFQIPLLFIGGHLAVTESPKGLQMLVFVSVFVLNVSLSLLYNNRRKRKEIG